MIFSNPSPIHPLSLARFGNGVKWHKYRRWQISLKLALKLLPIKTLITTANIQLRPEAVDKEPMSRNTAGNSQLQFIIMLIANDKRLPVSAMALATFHTVSLGRLDSLWGFWYWEAWSTLDVTWPLVGVTKPIFSITMTMTKILLPWSYMISNQCTGATIYVTNTHFSC